MNGVLIMSVKETERISILDNLIAKRIKQKQAARQLGVSIRQVRRMMRRYQREGKAGLIHKLRGKEGNRRITQEEKDRAIAVIRQQYADFGPTLAYEKLAAGHHITFGLDTLRKEMITQQLWLPKRRRVMVIHGYRNRRECFGDLVQLDGSPYDWFEGRSPCCTLLVFIDDATGKVPWAQFAGSETTNAYFLATRNYLERYGKPLAFYVDRHGVFRVNTTKAGTADTTDSNGITQFGRAMKELRIELIFAHSPQAKGRVERVNQTLQDRLVKEMRLRGINTIKEGNAFLPHFLDDFNRRFAVVPKSPANMHRKLLPMENLDMVLCQQYPRVLSRQLTISYADRIYQIETERPAYAPRHAPVIVREDMQGIVTIWYKTTKLAYRIVTQRPKAEILDSKRLNEAVDRLSRATGIALTVTDTPPVSSKDHVWQETCGFAN